MPIDDVDTPGAPGWFFRTLTQQLMERRPRLQALWDRYQGDAPLPDLGSPGANESRQRVWKAFQRKARTNYEQLIIACVLDRLTPIGFRLLDPDQSVPVSGAVARSTQGLVDAAARRVWAGNDMPTASGDLLEKFLVMGESYVIVGAPDLDEPGLPIVTEEDPRTTITAQDPVRPSREVAGLKMYFDDQVGRDVAYLYLPGRVIRAERVGREGTSELSLKRWRFNPRHWDVVDERALPAQLGKRLPIVRFANRGGVGEFENHLDHLDRINHMLLQRIVIATLQAFRQRAVKGVPRTDPKTGAEIDYCMDDQTQVFTARGWLKGHEVREGDLVRSIDPVSGLARWQPVTSVYRRVGRTQMVHMQSTSHDSMTTLNHRWLVNDVNSGTRRWATTTELNSRTRIPRAAMSSDAPQEAKFTDAFVELVSWWFTEGSFLSHGRGGQISQSRRVNSVNCARIEAAFHSMFGAPTPRRRQPLSWTIDAERPNGVVVYRFGAELHESLAEVAPDKVPTTAFLTQLTPAQLQLFVDTALAADGHVRANASVFGQRDVRRTEAFAAAAALAGRSVTFARARPLVAGGLMHEVTVSDRRLHATVPGAHNAGCTSSREIVEYDGLIWCPTVAKDHNFLARRNGKTFYTGNTDIFTADPGALWLLPATADLWESGQVDLTPILSSVKDDVRDLAAVLRLPVQAFLPDAANQSAEGASAAREGLVFRAEDRQVRASAGFARVMALAFAYLSDEERSDPLRIETLWRSIERWSLVERATAAVAAQTAGVPWEAVMTDWLGYEPDEIPLLRRQRADDALLAPAQTGEPVRGLPAAGGSTGVRAQQTSDPSTPSQPTSAGQTGPVQRGAA